MEEQLCLALTETAGFQWREPADHPWLVGSWRELELALLAQPECGIYRPDFALAHTDWCYPEPLRLLIEVDGHDFHERSREQAARDRARDRALVGQGSTVLRFTGSEIWRNPDLCAREVLAVAVRRAT